MYGSFSGDLHVKMLEDGRLMELLQPFGYLDPSTVDWPVPASTRTDGASIPRFLWSIIGGPFEGRYRKAAVVHDFYCDVRTRPWQNVHRMFFDAMRCAGVHTQKAKLLYFGVRVGGPRWNEQAMHNACLVIPPYRKDPASFVEISASSGGHGNAPAAMPDAGGSFYEETLPNRRHELFDEYYREVGNVWRTIELQNLEEMADEAREKIEAEPITVE